MSNKFNTIFMIPVRNDYLSVSYLFKDFKKILENAQEIIPKFILLDDGSEVVELELDFGGLDYEIIESGYKMGHQLVLNYGINYVTLKYPGINLVTLDGDGEDEPIDAISIAKRLLTEAPLNIVAARRLNRQNSFWFTLSYRIFRMLFKKTTGFDMRSGNFLGIKGSYVSTVAQLPGINNHVAASIIRYATKIEFMDFDRGSRIAGKSQMNLSKLMLHAYGAFAVFADILIARLTIFLLIFSFFTFICSVIFAIFKILGLFHALPGWTSLIFVQVISTTFVITSFSLLILFVFLKSGKR